VLAILAIKGNISKTIPGSSDMKHQVSGHVRAIFVDMIIFKGIAIA
jgi:hypothetical protein